METFIDGILPNVFFLDINPITVMENETRLSAGAKPSAPHADNEFLGTFVNRNVNSLTLFTANEMFTGVQKTSTTNGLNAIADTIIERVEALRDEIKRNDGFKNEVNTLTRVTQARMYYAWRELIRIFLNDLKMPIKRNHAIDLLHAAVPIVYCDFVLLDSHWKAQVEIIRQRLKKYKIPISLAQVYSKSEMKSFLSSLSNFNAR